MKPRAIKIQIIDAVPNGTSDQELLEIFKKDLKKCKKDPESYSIEIVEKTTGISEGKSYPAYILCATPNEKAAR